jgi:ABC-2 type transport system permease protein
MVKRIKAIIIKEFHHIMRDWQTLMIILLMPVMMMFLYGYALNMDLKEVPVVIVDPSGSSEVNTIVRKINGSTLFSIIGTVRDAGDPSIYLKKYHAKMVIRFPNKFSEQIRNGGNGAQIQVLIDGSDSNVGTILKNTIGPVITNATLEILNMDQPKIVTVKPRILYNEQQKSALFFVPGLMAIILLMISAMLTSLTITREKELGTMEQLLVSPIHPFEIIIGKIIPYLVLAFIDAILIMIVGWVVFGVEIAGSIPLLALAVIIYIFTALSIGLLISTIANNQQMAMMLVLPATMLPTIILSGFIFPIASLPKFLQLITCIIPATYFLEIIRGIILKGVGFTILLKPILILSAIGLFLIVVSIKRFKVKL